MNDALLTAVSHYEGRARDEAEKIVQYVAERKFLEASTLYQQLYLHGVPAAKRRPLSSAINSELLYPQSLELTSHGICRSFRFWSVVEKQAYLDAALRMIEIITDRVTENVCLYYGTALAVARDGDLIPHDDDIDLLVALPREEFETYGAASEWLIEKLADEGFQSRQAEPSLIHVTPAGSHIKFDIFVGLVEGDFVTSYPGKRNHIRTDDLFPREHLEMLGRRVPIPAYLDDVLSKIYGPSWETPDPEFSHNWSKDHQADLFGEA